VSYECRIVYILSYVLGKGNKILEVHDAVTPGIRAYIAQQIIRAPLGYNAKQVLTIDSAVTVEVANRLD
jgi:hypothetical protein